MSIRTYEKQSALPMPSVNDVKLIWSGVTNYVKMAKFPASWGKRGKQMSTVKFCPSGVTPYKKYLLCNLFARRKLKAWRMRCNQLTHVNNQFKTADRYVWVLEHQM